MFEYDEALIRRSLNIWGYDINYKNFKLIEHITMHGYKTATKEKPLLYVDNLQCCVSVYAWAPNFGFASHINTLVMRGDYYVDYNNKPIKCRRTEDLYDSIINSGLTFIEPIKIGISIGCLPVGRTQPSMKLINEGIKETIEKLAEIGIKAYQVEDINEWTFILDYRNGELIKPVRNMLYNASNQKQYCISRKRKK